MCKFCDLGALKAESFDTFFEGAASHGYRSMVCKHCSTTFFTQSAELAPAVVSAGIPQPAFCGPEHELVMLPG
ncbi:MAG: hypothetical protein FVQ81_03445 [Candidatus Glassbacteria bacterium]|nr:hypothetical protein [Candidatus Glassbacteria bacterium]